MDERPPIVKRRHIPPSSPAAAARRRVAEWLHAQLRRRSPDGRRWTQTRLSQVSGVSRQTIWSILEAQADARDETLRSLADALGVDAPVFEAEPAVESTEAEEQFRSFIRSVDRTVRAMAGDPDLFGAEETRVNRLAVIRAVTQAAEDAGRPVPEWVRRVHNEVISGTFR